MDLPTALRKGQYIHVLVHKQAKPFLQAFVKCTLVCRDVQAGEPEGPAHHGQTHRDAQNDAAARCIGLAALAGFLQANVTGPVLESEVLVELLTALEQETDASTSLRRACLASLDVDGVSAYSYIQSVELFCLARWLFLSYFEDDGLFSGLAASESAKREDDQERSEEDPAERSLAWLRLRIHSWHYKLLMEPNAGPGSVFNRMTQWSDLPSLRERIQEWLEAVQRQMDTGIWSRQAQVQFLLEKTNVFSMLGLDVKAREALGAAARVNRFEYALSGALGKRTRFQDKSTSQLIVLARSSSESGMEPDPGATVGADAEGEGRQEGDAVIPHMLPLNNDTLFEEIDFSDAGQGAGSSDASATEGSNEQSQPADAIRPSLRDLTPGNQPQLTALDQIILLSVATLKDAFSSADTLTLEEILPYATRVLSDKATNWQIYSQGLIVRSRIELHRSRTVERGVLQMQAVVDQVVVNTTTAQASTTPDAAADGSTTAHELPSIQVSAPDNKDPISKDTSVSKPTSFFPAAKPTEQAPPQVRLRYIHALATPPRWHLESELAFAWASVGSLVSALEIFKRLRLWAEVAICLASSSSADDEGGRGAGGEEKARALIRWRLFQALDASLEPKGGEDGSEVDVLALRSANFQGAERDPAPSNAPRLFCILGDIEREPKHYERAWELSKHRFSRAQRSLGEHYLQQHDWDKAREAYVKAVSSSRLDPQLWSRLGDINLRLGLFAEAAEAFGRAIAAASDASGGEDARTWSNLGGALYSLYTETMAKRKQEREETGTADKSGADAVADTGDEDEAEEWTETAANQQREKRDPVMLLSQSLAAFKRGATISHDNWRIWDNVVTLASRMRPPAIGDMVLALRNVVTLRKTEKAVDIDVLRMLLSEAVLMKPKPADGTPARGSQEKAVCDLIEVVIVPLITNRSELWELVTRERVWRGDLAGAIDAAEKGWRATIGGASSTGLLGPTVAVAATGSGAGSEEGNSEERNWLENASAWDTVVARTDELVAVLENYGPEVAAVGSRWKPKARSAVRSVMGKGKERWEGSAGWATLTGLLENLR